MMHRQFFGDSEHDFVLSADLLLELERKVGAGIGAICKRLFAGYFAMADIAETVRLALIGGGRTPEEASALVDLYVRNRPIAETYPLAVAILETAWFGQAGGSQEGGSDGSS